MHRIFRTLVVATVAAATLASCGLRSGRDETSYFAVINDTVGGDVSDDFHRTAWLHIGDGYCRALAGPKADLSQVQFALESEEAWTDLQAGAFFEAAHEYLCPNVVTH